MASPRGIHAATTCQELGIYNPATTGYSAALFTKCFAKLAFKPKMKKKVVAKDVHRLASH